MVVQVNGKVRDRIEVPPTISEEEAEAIGAGLGGRGRGPGRGAAPAGHREAAPPGQHRRLTGDRAARPSRRVART